MGQATGSIVIFIQESMVTQTTPLLDVDPEPHGWLSEIVLTLTKTMTSDWPGN